MAGMPPQGPHANLENPLSHVARAVDKASSTLGEATPSTAPPPHTHETPPSTASDGYDIYMGTTPGGKVFADSMNAMNKETHPRGKR